MASTTGFSPYDSPESGPVTTSSSGSQQPQTKVRRIVQEIETEEARRRSAKPAAPAKASGSADPPLAPVPERQHRQHKAAISASTSSESCVARQQAMVRARREIAELRLQELEIAERLSNRSRSVRGDFGEDDEEGVQDKMDRLRRSVGELPSLPEGRVTMAQTSTTTHATHEREVVAVNDKGGAVAGQLPPLPPCNESAGNGDQQERHPTQQSREEGERPNTVNIVHNVLIDNREVAITQATLHNNTRINAVIHEAEVRHDAAMSTMAQHAEAQHGEAMLGLHIQASEAVHAAQAQASKAEAQRAAVQHEAKRLLDERTQQEQERSAASQANLEAMHSQQQTLMAKMAEMQRRFEQALRDAEANRLRDVARAFADGQRYSVAENGPPQTQDVEMHDIHTNASVASFNSAGSRVRSLSGRMRTVDSAAQSTAVEAPVIAYPTMTLTAPVEVAVSAATSGLANAIATSSAKGGDPTVRESADRPPSGRGGGGPNDGDGGGGGPSGDPPPPPPPSRRRPRGGGDGGGPGGDSSGPDGSEAGSSDDDAGHDHERRRKGHKVADEVKTGNLPTPAQFRAWKNTLFQNVNAASGRMDDKALEWVMKTENLAIPDADMATCKRKFAILDRRLSAALQRIAHGELGRQITQAAEDALREGRAVRGRELLRLIIRYFQTNRTADAV